MNDLDRLIDQAARTLLEHGPALVLTGAGISVPSGIPDFRSPGGLWSRFDPEKVASVRALEADPRAVWEFLLEALQVMGRARPNPAHKALADMEAAGRVAAVVTQNIDGLHQAAGSKRVVEFHGNIRRWYCRACGQDQDPGRAVSLTVRDIPWTCACGGMVRPDLVFFGETIPRQALDEAFELAGQCRAVLVVGTSGEVAPANLLGPRVKEGGGRMVEVNLGRTAFERMSDVRIDAPAEQVLPRLSNRLTELGK